MFPLRDTIRASSFPAVNWLLIITNAMVFLFQRSLGLRDLEMVINIFGVVPVRFLTLSPLAPVSLVSSQFLHGGWMHVIANLWTLYIFGDNVEDRMGHSRYLIFYLLCGVLGGVVQVLSGLAENHSFSAERIRDIDAQFEDRLSRIESKVNTVADTFDQKVDRFLKRLDEKENDEVKNLVTELGQMFEKHSVLLGNKEDSSIEPEIIPDLLLEPEGDSVPTERELSNVLEGTTDSIKNEDSADESDSELEFGEEEILQVDTESEFRVPFKTPAANPVSLSLIAVVNVGIGNTLFVRGDGPGLSWTEGVPMKFLEIGKWEWSIDNTDEAAVIQIFKNDEISAFGEEINVGLGERVEVYPKFPT